MWDDDSNALGAARDLIGSATVFFKDIPPGQGLQDGEGLLPGRWVGAGGGGNRLSQRRPTPVHQRGVIIRPSLSVRAGVCPCMFMPAPSLLVTLSANVDYPTT